MRAPAFALLAALLASCAASTRSGPVPAVDAAEHWPDFARTLRKIRCALADQLTGDQLRAAIRFTVHAVDDRAIEGRNCLTFPTARNVAVRRSYRTAHESCMRHEFFAHVLPWVTERDPNRDHKPRWTAVEARLQRAYRRCE